MTNTLPILYSFRRCPYAIRARLTVAYAGIPVEIREIQLKNKPTQLVDISPKATVPVLQLPDGRVLEESLDIMHWALQQHDPDNWLDINTGSEGLVGWNDGNFKHYLDRYKYADRYPEFSELYYRQQAETFLVELENTLTGNQYIAGNHFTWLDAAVLPFIRQFAAVDSTWFATSQYHHLKSWLDANTRSTLFASVMVKYPIWVAENQATNTMENR